MKTTDFRYLQGLRVRWAEVDMQKIVFNGHYLMYFDTAVGGYWRALAMPYHDTMEQLQGDLYVRKATLEYLGSARYDEKLNVGIACKRIGNSSLLFAAAVFRGDQCLVHGELVYVFADPLTQTSRPVPDALRKVLQAFEAGEPMFEVQTGDWTTHAPAAQVLRREVFVKEEGMPDFPVSDVADPQALHATARNRFDSPLASGRLTQPAPGLGQIGRMATASTVRGAGMGWGVLQALLAAARKRGDHQVKLLAKSSAISFYGRAGFLPFGPAIEEAGVQHQEMRLDL
jgi:YbgC/YbaW family acyl-CoA thioester hydrolase